MITQEQLKIVGQHRPLGEIAAAIAEKDMANQALKVKARSMADGYRAQMKALETDLNRLRTEYMAASIAAEGGR